MLTNKREELKRLIWEILSEADAESLERVYRVTVGLLPEQSRAAIMRNYFKKFEINRKNVSKTLTKKKKCSIIAARGKGEKNIE